MVKTSFSTTWKRSEQRRKQRKYRYNAPLHIKQKFMHVHLSPELRKKYILRNIQISKGDKIRILRGKFKKQEGKVERVNLKEGKVFVTGIEVVRKEGSKILVPLNPSNLMIIDLNLNDKRRRTKIESNLKETEKKVEKNTDKIVKKEGEAQKDKK